MGSPFGMFSVATRSEPRGLGKGTTPSMPRLRRRRHAACGRLQAACPGACDYSVRISPVGRRSACGLLLAACCLLPPSVTFETALRAGVDNAS
jgi:hypothetical protein